MEKNPETKEDVEQSTLTLLDMMIRIKKPEDMPKGLDNFRIMNRLHKAFDKAEKTGELVLEETDYKFLNDTIVKDVPAFWGRMKEPSEAIEEFVNCVAEK